MVVLGDIDFSKFIYYIDTYKLLLRFIDYRYIDYHTVQWYCRVGMIMGGGRGP